MPPGNPLAMPSLVLSLLVLGAAGGLALYQWAERHRRDEDDDLSDADLDHYRRRDIRRWRGIIVMALIGLAASTGAWINPRAGRDEARLVFGAWVVVGALLLVLLGLAILDWIITTSYAIRQRHRLARERQAFIDSWQARFAELDRPSDGPPASAN